MSGDFERNDRRDAMTTPAPLSRWGSLEIREKLGEGTYGEVFRAWHPQLEIEVALKLFKPTVGAAVSRALGEARALARVRHEHVVRVYDVQTYDGRAGLWMELVRGRTLQALLNERGTLGYREAALIGQDLCRALAAVHQAGLTHGDIKPQNVVREESGRVVLMDFGAGRWRGSAANTGIIVGTPMFLAPEVLDGGVPTPAADIYSLGVLIYHLVTGTYPMLATTIQELQSAQTRAKRLTLRDTRRDLPALFAQVVDRAIAVDPRARHGSIGELEADLMHSVDAPPQRSASLAVLPFVNLNADDDHEYFSDGLTEELINVLSRLEGLRVMSRTSAFEFKGKAIDIRAIGAQLGVANVLEGSVRKSDDRLRVTVRLVNTDDGCQLWTGRFDRTMTDIFDIQDEIAQTIASSLEIALASRGGQALVKRYTGDMEAYQLYLRGRFHWNRRSNEGFEKAREYFEAALACDSRYAPAYAGLADYYISVASWGLVAPDEAWPRAKAAALTALDLDPSLADAHVTLAVCNTYYDWNWQEGERGFRRARELNPSDTNACVQFATYLIQRGRLAEARWQMERALEIDPLSGTVNTYVAGVAYYARQYDRAIALCRTAMELSPQDIELMCVLALSYEGQGNLAEAIAAFETARKVSGNYPIVVASLAATYAKAGNRRAALQLVDQLREVAADQYVPPIAWAWTYTALGELDVAFDWLDKSADAHEMLLAYAGVAPAYDALRPDPRFAALIRRIGLNPADEPTTEFDA
ncbi:MAG TPA: protein kinase [Vicinamibacterales bacterium]|nr:protein kinase [Vicinamibacterales bacterium]